MNDLSALLKILKDCLLNSLDFKFSPSVNIISSMYIGNLFQVH